MEQHTVENLVPRGVEEVGCKISSGAPTVSQTAGQVKVKVTTMGRLLRDG